MKRSACTTIIFLCLTVANFAFATDLRSMSFYNDKLSISIPKNFKPSPENDAVSKFAENDTKKKIPSWNKPKYVFFDNNHNNIIVDLKPSANKNLGDYINGLVRFIKQQNYHATILNKNNLVIDGHQAILLRVKSPMPDSSILYSATLASLINNERLEILIFLNNKNYKNWDRIMESIIQSIKINNA